MHLATLPLAEAVGHLLVHNVADRSGQKILKKGLWLTDRDVARLRAEGHERVEVAVLDAEDVHEDAAAERIAAALLRGGGAPGAPSGPPLRATRGVGGRVNLHAESNGVLYVEAARLAALNTLPGVTLATRPPYAPLGPGFASTQVATLKIIPYALPRWTVEQAEARAAAILRLAPLRVARVALLVTAEAASAPRLQRQFEGPTRERLARLGSVLATVETVEQDEAAIAQATARLLAAHDALIVGGQTSIMDEADTTPRALARAGAEVALHGAPVEPGNLLALAYRGAQWILCAPGCAKSPEPNVVDLVLPRLLAGERLGRAEVAALGLGGLL